MLDSQPPGVLAHSLFENVRVGPQTPRIYLEYTENMLSVSNQPARATRAMLASSFHDISFNPAYTLGF